MMFDKFITKENILIAIVVFGMIIQSNYFATKLDVSILRNEMLNMKLELQQYSDTQDKEILKEIDNKYDKIMVKLDKLK